MQSAEWLKIKEIFYQTLDLPKKERNEFLAKQEDSLRLEVLGLLASHEHAENFIAEPALVEFELNIDKMLGKKIDDYQIIKEIGAGGMGKVYLAKRVGFEQKFALKLIKRGMDTEAVLKRFVRERQILSRLEHPNIARLLNVGSTESGLPYFVMEYIEGETINNFCDSHNLSINDRLSVFQKVCEAVKYAHQNLIVHRDIKPSNILVTSEGTPKLLDFGIAKLLNAEDLEATATQARVLTPEYASPEQINNLPITTATDVYSLGVVLFEILSGKRPSSGGGSRSSGGRKTKKNKDETQAVKHSESAVQNQKSLTGDVDNIVQKSIREDPERRYQSVQEFSEDIRRFLNGLPVTATADSTLYRFSKFIGRHKQGVLVGTFLGFLILTTSGIAIWKGILANRERVKSEKRFEQVRKLANIVLFEYHDGIAQLPGATAMREKMVKDSLEFLDNLSAETIDNLQLKRDIVKAYRKVGDIQAAPDTGNVGKTNDGLVSYQKALAIQEKIVEQNPDNIDDKISLAILNIDIGLLIRNIGEMQIAENNFQKSLDILKELQIKEPDNLNVQSALAKALWNIANLQTAQNNLKGSLENYAKAAQLYEKLSKDEPLNTRHLRNLALTNKNIGSVLQLLGENEKALQHFQISLAIDLQNAGKNQNNVSAQLDLSFTFGTIASALRGMKNFTGAIENHQKAIEIREKVFAADAKNVFAENAVASGYQEFGRTYLAEQKYLEAEKYFAKSQTFYQKMVESDPENNSKRLNLAESLSLLGYAVGSNKNFTKASGYYEESLAIYRKLDEQNKLSPLEKRRFAAVYLDLAEILNMNKKSETALENLTKAEKILDNEKVKMDAKEELEKLKRLMNEVRK